MRNVVVFTLFLFGCWQVSAQNYLQLASDCFDKGDYECAKRNLTLYQTFEGKDMTAQIQKAEECFRNLLVADEFFKEKEYERARDRYKAILDINPKDPYARRQYNACLEQLKPSRHLAEPEMVFVQGGTFVMGATKEQGRNSEKNEKPIHKVTVSDFYIGKYPVTQKEWKAIMDSNPSPLEDDNLPVVSVSWNDVQEFIRRLNSATGKQYRLATEAEWEYAARGGNRTRGYKYSGSNNLNDVAWHSGSSGNVGTKRPNELGIYDMSGSVWEWCNDWYGSYGSNTQTDPKGPQTGSGRVLRGGSWNSPAVLCRVSYRTFREPSLSRSIWGFRVVLPL